MCKCTPGGTSTPRWETLGQSLTTVYEQWILSVETVHVQSRNTWIGIFFTYTKVGPRNMAHNNYSMFLGPTLVLAKKNLPIQVF
jgi:hypothetical protein